jgi:O-antigen/teichoic acid export membrane protein
LKIKVHSQLIYSLIFKFISMVLVFLTTSLIYKYLGSNDYGIWVTIYSIISWVYFLDFGFSNVIKTKLPTLLNNKEKEVSILISTIYIGIGAISLLILLLFLTLNCFISFADFLNIDVAFVNFNGLLFLNLLFSTFILIIGNYKALFVGVVKTHVVEFSLMVIQLFIVFAIFILYKYDLFQNYSKIFLVSNVFGLLNLLIGIGFTIYFFKKNKGIVISFKNFDLSILKINASLGLKYFIIQACMIVIFSTDYVLITKYFGSKDVANYDIVLKVFQVPMLLVIAALSPYWSIFSKTFSEKKHIWIKKTLVTFNLLFPFFIVGIAVLTFLINEIIYLWMNVRFEISKALLITISIYVSMRTFTAMYNYFLNGINKINLSLWLTIFGAVINIPICIALIKTGFGVSGIVIGTCISILPTTIALPIQAFRIINRNIKEDATKNY